MDLRLKSTNLVCVFNEHRTDDQKCAVELSHIRHGTESSTVKFYHYGCGGQVSHVDHVVMNCSKSDTLLRMIWWIKECERNGDFVDPYSIPESVMIVGITNER